MVNKMNENMELLIHIYKTAEMGAYSTKKLLSNLKERDNKIKNLLEYEIEEYEKYKKLSKSLLINNDITPKDNGMFTKMSSNMGIMMETIKDNSDSAIASMLIEGMTMGITEMSSKINKYKDITNNKIIKLAKKFLKFHEKEINKLKTFM